jgi:hypothetical protein
LLKESCPMQVTYHEPSPILLKESCPMQVTYHEPSPILLKESIVPDNTAWDKSPAVEGVQSQVTTLHESRPILLKESWVQSQIEPEFVKVKGAQKSILRYRFRHLT